MIPAPPIANSYCPTLSRALGLVSKPAMAATHITSAEYKTQRITCTHLICDRCMEVRKMISVNKVSHGQSTSRSSAGSAAPMPGPLMLPGSHTEEKESRDDTKYPRLFPRNSAHV